jgi:hypothetical protein
MKKQNFNIVSDKMTEKEIIDIKITIKNALEHRHRI